MRTDVSRAEHVERAVATAEREFGRLDYLFNNAGIEGAQAPTADCSEDSWRQVIGVNLSGVFFGMKCAIPAMLRTGGGAIVNNASVAGLVGFAGIPAYAASKGGVVQPTRTAALEYATGRRPRPLPLLGADFVHHRRDDPGRRRLRGSLANAFAA